MLIASYQENPRILDLIQELKSKGIKTAVCTNNFKDRLQGLVEEFNLNDRFDIIISSYEEGITKPDERIFRRLVESLNLKPEEILISDDREVNIDMLKQIGFEAFLFTNLDDFF
ncbi:MAG: HAD-IA family hydrolase [bacterium]